MQHPLPSPIHFRHRTIPELISSVHTSRMWLLDYFIKCPCGVLTWQCHYNPCICNNNTSNTGATSILTVVSYWTWVSGFPFHRFQELVFFLQKRTCRDKLHVFIWAEFPSCHPTNSVKTLKESQCTEGWLLWEGGRKRRGKKDEKSMPYQCH